MTYDGIIKESFRAKSYLKWLYETRSVMRTHLASLLSACLLNVITVWVATPLFTRFFDIANFYLKLFGIIRVFLRQSCSGDVYWPHDFNMKIKRVMQTPNICWNVYQLLFWVAKFLGIQNILWPFDLWGRIFMLWQVYRKKRLNKTLFFSFP